MGGVHDAALFWQIAAALSTNLYGYPNLFFSRRSILFEKALDKQKYLSQVWARGKGREETQV
jgi:hypothetical protein